MVLAGRPRRLADITCPFLNVYGTHDHVTPPASVAPLAERIGSERTDTLVVRSGHIGLLVGGSARKQTLPKITEWLASVEGGGQQQQRISTRDRRSAVGGRPAPLRRVAC